jgi:hypothetical protein
LTGTMRESGRVTMTPLTLDGETYGWRIKETATHFIDVLIQIYNYRISRTPKARPLTYDRFYCYAGKDRATLLLAVLAANAWDGADDTDPLGWSKNGQTGEWRGRDGDADPGT